MEKEISSKKEQETEKKSDKEPIQDQVTEDQVDQQDDHIQNIETELTEAKDKYIRLYAEFENHRRRTAKEKIEIIRQANEELISSLLPVLDDFERAQKLMSQDEQNTDEGFTLIYTKLKKILEQYKVIVMDIEKGSDFNADYHEAVTQVGVEEDEMKGKIVDVLEKGYFLNDKVIRFAKVAIGH